MKHKKGKIFAISIAVGAGVGAAMGAASDDIGDGMAVGVAIAVVLGVVFKNIGKKEELWMLSESFTAKKGTHQSWRS